MNEHTPRPWKEPSFLPVDVVAYKLGVPVAWLKREADNGRIPVLRIRNRRLLHLKTVEDVLIARGTRTKDDTCEPSN